LKNWDSVARIKRLLCVGKKNAHCEDLVKPTSTFHGQNAEFFGVKAGGAQSNRSDERRINSYVIWIAQK
jgi:hypothetical protein